MITPSVAFTLIGCSPLPHTARPAANALGRRSGGSRVLLSMALDKFLQVFTRVDNMFPQSNGSYFRIFRLAGCEKFAVRLAGPVEVAGKDKMETSVAVAIDVQSLQEREHERAIGGSVEGGMKTPVPLAPGLHFGILLERLLVLNQDVFRTLEILLLYIRDGVTEHIAFENGARFEHLHDLVG